MRTPKLVLAVLFSAAPATAFAQPGIGVGVDVRVNANVGDDSYDTTAPGDPVESVDVFYDQLSPYGVWVDEPDAGRVFIPDQNNFVPYTTGHWQYTTVGFVWVSNEPFGWATSHYGRWAYSSNYGRWVWAPDTEWGPAWVDWRQTGTDFGWAPLAPAAYIRAGYQPPVDSWRYCGSDHILDVNVTRYYEPRDRVVVIQREARPIEHYSTVSNVRVVVGPPPSVLREHRVVVRPVRIEARTAGRYTPAEAHAQVVRAQEHRQTFEVQNQQRIETKPQIREAHTKVIETHPQLKVQVDARMSGHAAPAPAPNRPEPARPEPGRQEQYKQEPGRPTPTQPARPETNREPARPEPTHQAPPQHAEPHPAPPQHEAPKPPQYEQQKPPQHEAPKPPQAIEHPAPQQHAPAPPQHTEPQRTAPQPQKQEPKQEPKRPEPEKKDDKRDEHH